MLILNMLQSKKSRILRSVMRPKLRAPCRFRRLGSKRKPNRKER